MAVIYFSTTADQDLDGMGVSYGVFIDQDGQAKGLKMQGLEVGNLAKSKDKLFLEEKNKVRLLGNGYQEFPMEKYQHTGVLSGYIERENIFFSIYNSGFSQNGYNSDVRYGNEKGFYTDTIPYYIESSGLIDDRIYLLTSDDDNTNDQSKFALKEVSFDDKLQVKQLTNIESENGLAPVSPVLADKDYYYIIMAQYQDGFNGKVSLIRVNKQSYAQDMFTLINYKDMDDINKTLIMNSNRSAYIYEKELYFVDGLGDVYTFHSETKEIKKKFSFKEFNQSLLRYDQEISFNGDSLYFFRYNPAIKKHFIEKYELKTGKLEKQVKITGIPEILLERKLNLKSLSPYDFLIVND